jgi:molecular chaperone Hsp33
MSELHKFLFEGMPVRGMLVRLTDDWQELLRRRGSTGAYPPAVSSLLGEMAAAATLMHANIKFEGALTLQIFGDGPVKLAVAEARSDLGFRATAKVTGELPAEPGLAALLNVGGKGRCAITLTPAGNQPGQQPYQGVVGLRGDQGEPLQKLSEVLEHYMLQSEQLDTRLVLAADEHMAAGLLVQRLPLAGEGNLGGTPWKSGDEDQLGRSEAFNRIAHLTATLTSAELLSLDADTVLRRLFWEEPLRRYPAQPLRFACTCSPERVRGMLEGLGADEVHGIIAERGEVEIGCDFCGRQYRFDAVDVGELFTPGQNQPPGSPLLQ